MKHVITRTVIGIIWLAAAIVSLFTANLLMAAIGGIVGVVYLISANNMRKNEKDNK